MPTSALPKSKTGRSSGPPAVPEPSAAPTLWRTAGLEMAKVAAAAIVGGVVALTTPVRAVLLDLLWTKPPKLEIVAPTDTVHEGDEFALRVIIQPDFPGTVPSGTLRVTVPEALQQQATATLAVAGGDQATVLPDGESGLVLRALQAGEHTVTATFESPGRQRARAEDTLKIKIASRTTRRFASKDYLGGTWQLKRGANVWTMVLAEPKPRSVAGTLERGGSTWQVYGSHDGGSLWLYLMDAEAPDTRYFLEGKTLEEGRFIKASGTITTQRNVRGAWVVQKQPVEQFEANTPTGP